MAASLLNYAKVRQNEGGWYGMTAQEKANVPGRVVSLGDTRYRVEPTWGSDPEQVRLGAISKIASAPDGSLMICQRRVPSLVRLDRAGRVSDIYSVPMIDPHGVTIGADGVIYAVDRDGHQVLVLGPAGSISMVIGDSSRPRSGAPFNHPTDVAVTPQGDFFVADGYGNSHVHRFDGAGRLVRTWGGPGNEPGKFSTPHGICILAADLVAVGDRENDRIQVFDFDGGLVAVWADVFRPMELRLGPQGDVFVSDQVPRITRLDLKGRFVGRCRTPLPYLAHGMAVAATGEIYLSGPGASVVARLQPIK